MSSSPSDRGLTPKPRTDRQGGGSFFCILLLFLLSACSDPYAFRIKGEIDHLQQADFLVYSLDGGLNAIDTIHVVDGTFDWSTPLGEEATFFVVFPNLSEQVVFAQPGKVARMKGDANELRAIQVTGTEDNETLTTFRLEHLNDAPRQLQEAMKTFIEENPESRISTHLRRQLSLQGIGLSNLKKGDKLPSIMLPPDGFTGEDTLRLKPERPLLLIFWASWKRESTNNFFDILRLHHQVADLPAPRKIRPVAISLDVNPEDYTSTCRYDSVVWESRCYRQSWSTPIVEQFNIRELPYFILTDDSLRVVALGTDWKEDIQQAAFKIVHP